MRSNSLGVVMVNESELRKQVAKAIADGSGVSLNDLYDWLMERNANMHLDSLYEAVSLANEIEAILIERSSGYISDDNARAALQVRLNNIVVSEPVISQQRNQGRFSAAEPYRSLEVQHAEA